MEREMETQGWHRPSRPCRRLHGKQAPTARALREARPVARMSAIVSLVGQRWGSEYLWLPSRIAKKARKSAYCVKFVRSNVSKPHDPQSLQRSLWPEGCQVTPSD